MEQNIATWYQKAGIYGFSPQQYQQRIDSVKEFSQKVQNVSVCCELVKCFMGMPYDINQLSELTELIKAKDISFSEHNTKEIALLAGLAIYSILKDNEDDYSELAIMTSLVYVRGNSPFEEEVFTWIMVCFENNRLEVRDNTKEVTAAKIRPLKKMSEEERTDWTVGVDYVNTALANQTKTLRELRSNISSLQDQLLNKREEVNLLWWLVGGWSEIYDRSIAELSDKEAAVAVPFELMMYVETLPGPLAITRIMKRSLTEKGLSNEHTYGEYISEAGECVLEKCAKLDFDLSVCAGFTPILQYLYCRKDFPKQEDSQMARKLFEKDYDNTFLDKKVSVIEFANQLYLELELMSWLS